MTMTRLFLVLLLGCAILSIDLTAQEIVAPLRVNADQIKRAQIERSYPERAPRGSGSMSLPFFDDFSTWSLPTNDPDIPVELQRWVDNSAYINCNFPILPPTIGVATLDGLDATGYPYSFVTDSQGPADTLTSIPINLSPYDPEDNVYLYFAYQGGGLGNSPEAQDSLMVEFLAPLGGENPWVKVWSIEGSEMSDFAEVFIPIDQEIFLQDNFQFRFRNKATLTGNLDHWHIDYVFLSNNIIPESQDFFEVAFASCPNTLLQDYTAMPWTHFLVNPSQFMRTSIQTTQRNLSNNQADNITSGFKVDYEGTIWDNLNNFSNIVVLPNQVFTTDYAINSAPNNFIFDANVNDTCAVFDVSFYQDRIGILSGDKIGVPNNDSLVFKQVFENYYAYDDGSAEAAWSLNIAGGRTAVKYNVATTDSLYGLFIHFSPIQFDNSFENFILRVWADNNGVPGAEIGENFNFHQPNYYTDGPNVFAYYPLDTPVEVSGVIYVGFVQDSNAELNVGLDLNNNFNTTRLFYQLGFGSAWTQSQAPGSVMIRPVFKAGKTGVWNSIDEAAFDASLKVYPNPINDAITVEGDFFGRLAGGCEALVVDMQGRTLIQQRITDLRTHIDVSRLSAGFYTLVIVDDSRRIISSRKLVKQSH
jgi:hypothetical protein